MQKIKNLITPLNIVFSLYLALIVAMRLHLALTRYFDQDEFAHLHWNWLILHGHFPYQDFFINFTPVYYWILHPAFLLPDGPNSLHAARIIHIILWILSLLLTYKISHKFSLPELASKLAVAVAAVFPMVIDKSLEVRPDMFMTLMYLWAVYATLTYIPNLQKRFHIYCIGLLTGLSVLILLKIVYALPALAFLWWNKKIITKRNIPHLVLGFSTPIFLFILQQLIQGTLPLAYENIIHGSHVLKEGEGAFALWKPFAPLALVYVTAEGPSLPWYISTATWIFGILGALVFLKKYTNVSLFTLIFLASAGVMLYVFPTPYLQYFIPIGYILAISAGNLIQKIFTIIPIKQSWIALLPLLCILCFSYFAQYKDRIDPGNQDTEQVQVLHDINKISSANEPIYDMVGSYVYRPDGYYICCNVYSTFASRLAIPLPTLAESLIKSQTKFIIMDRSGKSFWLPTQPDLDYLNTNYQPSRYPKIWSLGYKFDCQDGACTQISAHARTVANSAQLISIKIPETFKLRTTPPGQFITFEGTSIPDGTTKRWETGIYRFTVPSSITNFTLQIDR